MTEQPTTPEPIQQSAFPTGRGVCWSAHPNIDGVVPPTQPYQPPARTRPAGWAKTGTVGASAQLRADEEPATVPARAYDGESNSQPGSNLAQMGVEAPVVDVTKPGFGIIGIAEARSWGIEPPPAVELLAMADDLNAHGGLDEAFVAGLLRQVIDDGAPSMVNTESVLKIRGELTEEELEQMRQSAIVAMAGVETVPPYTWAPTAERGHQHIWSMTSPVRCVECRRYLRPWWRRTLDRARRRFR